MVLFEFFPAWRVLVRRTRESSAAMAGFTAVATAVPLGVGYVIMAHVTNSEQRDEAMRGSLSRSHGLSSKVMGSVNKERLSVLLDEVKGKRESISNTRYKESLQGKTLGTSSGTSAGNYLGIKKV